MDRKYVQTNRLYSPGKQFALDRANNRSDCRVIVTSAVHRGSAMMPSMPKYRHGAASQSHITLYHDPAIPQFQSDLAGNS